MAKARSVKEVLRMNPPKIKLTGRWAEAFGEIAKTGTWLVWGGSGNGKSSFVMQLCKEFAKFGRVLYVSSEEGFELSFQNSLKRHRMIEVNNRMVLLNEESLPELDERLNKQKSPDFVVIDSFQTYGFTFETYLAFKKEHKDKLLIFISHAEGKLPEGKSAFRVMFNVSQKVYVEGYRAFTRGRFYGPLGHYDIWEEKAIEYHSKLNTDNK